MSANDACDPPVRCIAAVLWPAFLAAGALELLVFAFVDPLSLHTLSGTALDWSATAVYSVAFFAFWSVATAASLVSLLLMRSS